MKRILETARLILREYTPDDLDGLYAILSDAETMQHYPKPYDEKGTMRWLTWNFDNYQKYGFGLWAIELKESGEFIGDCGITMQNIDGELLPEIGYHIRKDCWRRGYAKEAASAVRDWLFEHTDFDAVYSYMNYTNVASYSTAASVGMKRIKEYTDTQGMVCCVYRLLRSEWEPKLFELTNGQRKCFAIPIVEDDWRKVKVKPSPYDLYDTYAYLDGRRIVKVIQVSDQPGYEQYVEYGVDQMLSEDGMKILPKTEKGKPQNFTSANLVKKTPVGMGLSFHRGYISVINDTTDQCYYRSAYNGERSQTLDDLRAWVEDWCRNTAEGELADIDAFAKREKIHQKFKEGDFFRFRIKRNLYGYGRILVDYGKMRKDGIEFWDVFMGKPLCVAVYHIATEDADVKPEQQAHLQMLPSQMIMDNIFYYGECEVIGNLPIAPDEDNYTIHYGKSIDQRKLKFIYYQSGKTFAALENGKELYRGFEHIGIGWDLDVELPILQECIRQKSNAPYWSMIRTWCANEDLRNPKFQKELREIKEQMGVH